ncbi:hypothetical protein BC940DRAFT_369200 [Gongronella butleri]|nr:hypothetical protein BC940DRAFT_369200 [Gongronella butleri]
MSSDNDVRDMEATLPYDVNEWSQESEVVVTTTQKLSNSSGGQDSTPSLHQIAPVASEDGQQRLFRHRSDYMGADHLGTVHRVDDKEGLVKFPRYNSEAVVTQHNFKRGTSDIVNMTSSLPLRDPFTDMVPLKGQVDARSRQYLIHGIDKQTLLQPSSDTSLPSSLKDDSSHPSFASLSNGSINGQGSQPSQASQDSSTASEDSNKIVESTYPNESLPLSYQPTLSPIQDADSEPTASPQPQQPNDNGPIVPATFDDDTENHATPSPPSSPAPQVQPRSPEPQIATNSRQGTPTPSEQPESPKQAAQKKETASKMSSTGKKAPKKRVSKAERAKLDASPVPSTRRRRNADRSALPRIQFASGMDAMAHRKYQALARSKGATVVDSWDLCTHFIVDEFVRTPSAICARISGKEIVGTAWLDHAAKIQGFPDELPYRTVPLVTEHPHRGKGFYFTEKAMEKLTHVVAAQLTKAHGAKMLAHRPDTPEDTVIVIVKDAKDKKKEKFNSAWDSLNIDELIED